MAQDNAAQAIANLDKALEIADKKIDSLITRLTRYETSLASIFTKAAKDAEVSTDDIANYVLKRFRSMTIKEGASPILEMLGLKEAKQEVQKIPTMFERVIADINARAQNRGQILSKGILNADAMVMEAKDAFARVSRELNSQLAQTRGSGSPLLERLLSIDQSILSKNDVKKLNDRIAQIRHDLEQVGKLQGSVDTGGRNQQLVEALRRYQEALQNVIQLEERLHKSQEKYASNISAVEGVTRRYNENEQALQSLQQRWEELNVKKQAGLINEQDFKKQTQAMLDEYDRLIKKRQEFEIGDLRQMSSQRVQQQLEEEERLRRIRKENTEERIRDEKHAEQMIAQELARRAKNDKEMAAAVKQQAQYQRDLNGLQKEYDTLKSKPNKNEKDIALLKQMETEMARINELAKNLDKTQKGSRALGQQIVETEQIKKNAHQINEEYRRQRLTLEKIAPLLRRIGYSFGIYFSGRSLIQFVKKLVETRGQFEMQFVAMKQIIQDTDEATKIWNQTMQQALKSPFKAMQLVDYTKKLAAYRIENEKLFETTKRLADVSAGLGVDMGRLILAYGQVKSANFLRASEVRQFTEAGVNIAGNLADYFTELEGRAVSTAEVMERITKRMVSFADVEEIFRRMTDEGGIFYNMQEVQAQTVKGQLMKLKDAYEQMLNTIGQSKQGTIMNLITKLNDLVKNWKMIAIFLQKNVVWMTLLIPLIVAYRRGSKLAAESTLELAYAEAKASFNMKKLLASVKSGEIGMKLFTGAVNIAKTALKTFIPFLVIEGLILLTSKLTDARREATRLQNNLSKIRQENSKKATDEIDQYDKLKKKMNELNRGSVERKNVIDQINSKYGKYLGFIVDETTKLDDLNEARERVVNNIRETARARAEEAAAQRIQEDFISKEQKVIGGNWFSRTLDNASLLAYRDSKNNDISVSIDDASKFAEYYRQKIENLTDKQVEEYAKDRDKLLDITQEWFEAFIGYKVNDIKWNRGFKDLADLYIKEESRIREARERISLELGGYTKEQQEALTNVNRAVSDALEQLPKAGKGDKIQIDDIVDFEVPTDLGDKVGVFEAIKQEINKRKDDFIIELKLKWGYITEEQADEAKNAGKSTGDIFVDEVNKEVTKGILESKGISMSYSELMAAMLDPSKSGNWDDDTWNNVNEAIDLITRNLITSSDIVNGISSFTKELSANLENGRLIIDEAVKKQNLIVDGTEEEVKKAQEAVDKAKERYKWLLMIAKLLGIDTKAQDEIVEERGYDLSIGQKKLAAVQKAFIEKFGEESNTYGKPLSQIGVTENQKALADAYHKQDEELQGLIKTKEKALNLLIKEGKLTDEDIEKEKAQIENLKGEQKEAAWLAEIFGYIAKAMRGGGRKENASKLISLIKEMRSEYDKLSKSAYSYAKSEDKVRESYKDSVKEILGKAGITDYDFTTNEGMIAALQKVKSYATKLGKDAAAEVQKYIDQLETEAEINIQVKKREDFARQMEKMFNDYELTIDLKKFSLPSDELAGIFDFDLTTLEELREAVDDIFYDQAARDALSEDSLKQIKDFRKKIDEMERKSLLDRLKKYTEYLTKGRDEAVQIHLDELKAMAEIDELYERGAFSDEQYDTITKAVRKETDEKLAKQVWKDFKESDYYTTMFQDIEHVATSSIDLMIERLKGLQKSMSNLDPTQVKEIVQSIEKLEKQKRERSPLRSFFEDIKTWNSWSKKRDKNDKWLNFLTQGEGYWLTEKAKKAKEVAQLEQEYNKLALDGEQENAAAAKERWEFAKTELDDINERLEKYGLKISEINEENNKGYAAMRRTLQGVAQGARYFSDMASTAGTIATEMMDMFDGVDDASKKLAKDIADIATNSAMLAADIAKAIASEGTDVGSMIDGLVRTWNIIKGSLSASEADINRTIEKQTELLEDLEWKLERLKRARDRAWDVITIKTAEAEIESILQSQIRAYDALIAAEEDRKSKDKELIKQWKQEREELFETWQDEKEEFDKTFGGIGEGGYSDAAQGFVDAWKSAFLETGDGLQGLQDHFDEFLNEWFVKQATMHVAGKMLEPLFRDIDDAVDKYSDGGTGVMMDELEKVRERFGIIAPELSAALEEMAGWWNLGGEGSLSGLAAGIQGMTEEQANILESYWNSVRGYTQNIDSNVATIVGILTGRGGRGGEGGISGGIDYNPQLQQMELIAQNTKSINTLLQAVTKSGHSLGGQGIKVFLN